MWQAVLKAEAEATSQAEVARRIGYSPATVSLVLAGRYTGNLERVAARVIERLGRVACPHLGHDLTPEQCESYRCRAVPTSGREAVRFWQCCQQCSAWKSATEAKP